MLVRMFRRNCWLLAVVLLIVAPAWSADFVVHGDQPIIDSFQGFGSHCNAWPYCKPNWGTISTNQNIAQLENLFVDLAPQQIRVFVEIQPDSPQQSDPAVKASVIKTIQLARRPAQPSTAPSGTARTIASATTPSRWSTCSSISSASTG